MRAMFHLLLLICTSKNVLASLYIPESKVVHSSEAFFIPIDRKWFSEFSYGDQIEYTASLLDMPDLPNWMFCRHPVNNSNAFLYGSAEESGVVQIEIIALNKNTYQTARKILKLNVEQRSRTAQYEVEMKFLNLNVEDMFRSSRLAHLIEVFQQNLWKESEEVYITKVISSLDAGGRLPLNPREKEGVIVRIGGTYTFSPDLQNLEREVQPLRNRLPCPRDYKRTSVERLFRSKSFVADWCSFRLLSDEHQGTADSSRGWSDPPFSSVSLTSEDFNPQSSRLPRRDFVFDFIVSVIIPTSIVGVLSTALTCIMCCNKDGSDKNNDGVNSLQLEHYKFVQHANSNSHRLAIKKDSLPCSGSTLGSSFPSSRDGSPSTLPKGNPRPTSRTGTLRSIMLPPPPPYSPSR